MLECSILKMQLRDSSPGGFPVTGEDQRHLSVLLVEDNEVNQKNSSGDAQTYGLYG